MCVIIAVLVSVSFTLVLVFSMCVMLVLDLYSFPITKIVKLS